MNHEDGVSALNMDLLPTDLCAPQSKRQQTPEKKRKFAISFTETTIDPFKPKGTTMN